MAVVRFGSLNNSSRTDGMLGALGFVTWPASVQEARQSAAMAELPRDDRRKIIGNRRAIDRCTSTVQALVDVACQRLIQNERVSLSVAYALRHTCGAPRAKTSSKLSPYSKPITESPRPSADAETTGSCVNL